MNLPDSIIVHISDLNPWTGKVFKDAAEVTAFHTAPKHPTDGVWLGPINPQGTARRVRYGRGWRNGGYQYTIQPDGTIEFIRAEDEEGAHAIGFNNHSIGICLLAADGNFKVPQLEALVRLVRSLQLKYRIPTDRVWGHKDVLTGSQVGKKTCPDFDIWFLRQLLEGV